MRKNIFQKQNLLNDSETRKFTAEEKKFMSELYKLADEIKPKQEFVEQLEHQIIDANQQRNGKVNLSLTDKAIPNRHWVLAFSGVGIIILALVVISFLAIPSLRVAAREALGFWIKTEDIQVIPDPTAIPTVNYEEIPIIVKTIEQVMEATQQATPEPTQVEYVIKLPTRLPEGYQINYINTGQRGNAWVDLSNNAGSLLTLQIQPVSQVEGTILGPDDKVVEVNIGDLAGEYVRGGWALNHSISGQIKPEQAEKLIWIDDTRFHKLRWNDDNLNYYLVFAGGRRPGDSDYLGMNDLVTIAASMQPVNQTKGSPKTFIPDYGAGEEYIGYIKEFQQLEALAGFAIPEPSFIPKNYDYIGGEVVMVAPFVDLQYICDDPKYSTIGTFGFTLEILRISEEELAQEMENFGQEEIGQSALIESVLINGVTAEYVKGYWGEDPSMNEKVWNNNTHYHILKWYKGGFLYTVRTMGIILPDYQGNCLLTKENLIEYAGSLRQR